MNDNKYYQDVVEITKQVLMIKEELNEDTNFTKDLGATSINLAQLMNAFEDQYGVEVPFMKFKRCHTVGEVAAFLEELVEG